MQAAKQLHGQADLIEGVNVCPWLIPPVVKEFKMIRFFATLAVVGGLMLAVNTASAQHHHGYRGYQNFGGSGTVISVGFGNGGGITYGRGIPAYGGIGYGVPVYGYTYARPVYGGFYAPAPIYSNQFYRGHGYGGYYGRPGCNGFYRW